MTIESPTFTIGQGRQCDLWVGDPTVSKSLCNLKRKDSEVYELWMPLIYMCVCAHLKCLEFHNDIKIIASVFCVFLQIILKHL